MTFTILDTRTGEPPDLEQIALHETWAQGLIYCDMDCIALCPDGSLVVLDECGSYRDCPNGRFTVEIHVCP